ncbi:uncharacterized protein PHACADRAFT_31776 [Phanerochaete carnosa HHB-10118-sp]|uniref:Uncharacterized protein n=1 Tax=Phanerochaete carnosa (strain HHB-10118-sp) TaxID=650164 RepID=K5VZE7_PHACS|nr:uncharacterized protein PHACADRAFT_31776 [Phanerochaete carnosa HHB-10118-sp]EKM51989.1 hypothetical protein PHACADRAFT_31776 [Phanerochaete carnosa HHB-10118-sp]
MPQAGLGTVHCLLAVLIFRFWQEMDDDGFAELEEALTRYSQEMHEYTLQMWTDSRRAAEEKGVATTAGRKKKVVRTQEETHKGKREEDKPLRLKASFSTESSVGKSSS